MLSQADLALYAAKDAGKSRWRSYEPALHLAAVDRLELRTELERAITAGAFALRYQPIVELRTGAMVGVEALVRWRHPRRGLFGAGRRSSMLAEETGLIVPLGLVGARLALWPTSPAGARGAAGDGRDHEHQRVRPPARATRASSTRWSEPSPDWDVPANSLVLEITETALLADDARVSADLAALRALGVRIAIDDFGTGYSSLDYLRRHAIDVLKIDRSFITGIETSGRQAALVGAIVHLARALDVRVVAEGVETPGQRDALLRAGGGLGQGYLFSAPVSANRIVPWLLARAPAAPRPPQANADLTP